MEEWRVVGDFEIQEVDPKEVAEVMKQICEPAAIQASKCIPLGCSLGLAHMEKLHTTEPEPIVCKWCGSQDIMKYGIRGGIQEYICKTCKRKFNAKETAYHMWTPTEQIGAALNMYYEGMSLADVARHLSITHNNPVDPSTVYRWLMRYTSKAIAMTEPLHPNTCEVWIVDETVVNVAGKNVWYWDIICQETRFLLASHLSRSRTLNDAVTVMQRAKEKAIKAPRFVISDGLAAYPDAVDRVFGSEAHHIRAHGLTDEVNTNVIERFHGSIKERYKVMRAFKTPETALLILDGFLIHYNFIRPHMSLKELPPKGVEKTPAEVAGINRPFKNWTELAGME